MIAFHPIAPEIVQPGWAEDVAAPAVDALPRDELAALASRRPWSVLHGIGVALDGEPGSSTRADGGHLERLRRDGALRRLPGPALLLYRVQGGGHAQVGLVGDLEVADCRGGRVRCHEHTEIAREAALSRDREELGADTSPVSVAFPPDRRLDRHLAELVARAGAGEPAATPLVSVSVADGTHHEVWALTDPDTVAALAADVRRVEAAYLLDGHHRIAAAARHAERVGWTGGGPDDPGRVLAALFPREQVRAVDYRRVVRRPVGVGAEDVLAQVAQRFAVTALADSAAEATPQRRGEVSLHLDGTWYRLVPHSRLAAHAVPDRLDEAIVQRHLLEAVFGVADPRSSPALSYVPGTVPLAELEARLGRADVAVVLCPLPLAELQAVADAGEVLPPKSTYFTPKLAAGVILHPRGASVPAPG